MESITQLQETDLLSTPLLVCRQARMEGEVIHVFSCKQRETPWQIRVLRDVWSAPIPGGFMTVSADEKVCSVY